MEDLFKALGMVDKNGKPFDETQISEQVFKAYGVSKPTIETGPAEKPPFRTWESCLQACLCLPADPNDEDFAQCPPAMSALAVGAVLCLELEDGSLGTFLAHAGSAYALSVPPSLRTLGLPDMAAMYEAFLSANQLDAAAIDALEEDSPLPPDPFTVTDRMALKKALSAFAESHPEVFEG